MNFEDSELKITFEKKLFLQTYKKSFKMQEYIYEQEFEVRDYECDIQGIVNNAVYQNYLEHTRHKFLKDVIGLDFTKLHIEGIDPVVFKIEIEYKTPLQSGDIFFSKLNMGVAGNLKMIFLQDIYRKSDNKLMITAKITAVVVKNGRPTRPDIFIGPVRDKLIDIP
jgi:acyl-CoA thioester hydrolase